MPYCRDCREFQPCVLHRTRVALPFDLSVGAVSYRVGRLLDGMHTSDLSGFHVRVVGPAWWQVGRWFVLWRDGTRSRLGASHRGRFYTVWSVSSGASPGRHR